MYVLLFAFATLVSCALILPGIAAGEKKGLDGIGPVVMTFLIFAAAAVLLALVMFIIAIVHRKSLSKPAIIVGIVPLPLVAAGLVVMFALMRFA